MTVDGAHHRAGQSTNGTDASRREQLPQVGIVDFSFYTSIHNTMDMSPNYNASPRPDRFIPARSDMDVDMCHHLLTKEYGESSNTSSGSSTPTLYKNLAKSLFKGKSQEKILAFKQKAPAPSESTEQDMKVLYSCTRKPTKTRKTTRVIPTSAETVLDAPGLEDNFYLNLLDWSCNNQVAIALQNQVFLWNGSDGSISEIECTAPGTLVTSVAWSQDGKHLAVGTGDSVVQLWDASRASCLRTLKGHAARVGALSWNTAYLSSGSLDNSIHHHDVRIRAHQVSELEGHTGEVCGLKWSPNGEQLASGGNDNLLKIWDVRQGGLASPRLLHSLTSHTAAVKAMAWAPFQSNLLATGGGTGDRHLRFWNTNTGAELDSVDTGSQVCSLQWANNGSKELVSSHGYSRNQLCVWRYPSLVKLSDDLVGHKSRVLHMALSPDGTTCATAAGDETLRFWKVFEPVATAKKKSLSSSRRPGSSTRRLNSRNIR